MSFEYDLLNAMRAHDLITDHINIEPGKYHRFKSAGICKSKCCEYRVFENLLGAHFRCFRRGIDEIWFAKSNQKLSYQERYAARQQFDRINQEREINYIKKTAKCAKFLLRVMQSQDDPTKHPYVRRKKIYPHAARVIRRMLVLQIVSIENELMSLQFIMRNGFKQFKKGAPTKGGMIWLCDMPPSNYDGVIRLCEGYATGCTIYSVTKSPVVCAMHAYNLVNVAALLRTKYIKAQIKICADNDIWKKENTGLIYAVKAAELTGYLIYYPKFDKLDTSSKPTDFNDLYILGGKSAVKEQLINLPI